MCYSSLGFNYLTNTTLKFILVSTDLDVRETKVRNVQLFINSDTTQVYIKLSSCNTLFHALSMSIKKKAEVFKVLSMNFNMVSSTWVGC